MCECPCMETRTMKQDLLATVKLILKQTLYEKMSLRHTVFSQQQNVGALSSRKALNRMWDMAITQADTVIWI